MATSKIIAALLGPTLVVSGAMVLLNLDAMPAIVEELSKSPMLIVLAGYAAFVPGLAIVHFQTEGGPRKRPDPRSFARPRLALEA